MKYEDMIAEEGEPKAEGSAHVLADGELPVDALPVDAVAETLEAEPTTQPKPWKAFILTGLLASLIGAGGGGYGVYAGLKAQAPDAAPDVTADIKAITTPLNAKIETLERRLMTAEAAFRDVTSRPEVTSDPVDLSSIEARLATLETATPSEIDPAALAALNAAQADGFEWPDTAALETRLTGLETGLLTLADTPSPEVLSDLMERIQALEARPIAQAPEADLTLMMNEALDTVETRLSVLENTKPVAPKVTRIAVLAFPKEALLQAAEDNTEGGFMKKALSKHVRVKDNDNPLTLIDQIEMDISKGRLEAAAIKFERLPAPVKAAGQAWYESVKASL